MTNPDVLDLFDRTLTHTAGVVAAVDPSQRTNATPCTAWTVESLLDHMVGTLQASVAFLEGRVPDYDPGAPISVIGDQPAEKFAETAAAALASYRVPGALAKEIDGPPGPMPAGMFLNFPLMDMWVHSWDLARATGQRPEFAEDITGYVTGFCRQAFTQNRPPAQVIGPEVAVSAAAPAIDRLVGFLGRRPD